MADWVHCNTCFRQPGSAPKFYLTSCGHIYCSGCLTDDGSKKKCQMCGRDYTTITLTSQMKPDVEIFFTDPLEIARRHFKQLTQVADFQKNHRNRLSAYWREKDAKNSAMLDGAKKKMANQLNELERYNQQLQEENNKLRSLVAAGSGASSGSSVRNRHGTPGRIMHTAPSPAAHAMRVAQGHKSPGSQQKRSSSPYSARRSGTTPNVSGPAGDVCNTPIQMRSTPTPPGPARLSIRTPPVNGRIGTVSTPTSTNNNLSLTPHGSLQLLRAHAKTPGLQEAVAGGSHRSNSPMIQSPASLSSRSERYYSSSQPVGSSPHKGHTSHSLSQPTHDLQRRQIQLNYIPKTPIISGPR